MPDEISFPQFISNSPCGKDLYQSGAQYKTAESISNHIKANNNDYKLVGLDGEWGSGKSNAISIIESLLGKDYHTFVYDTWAHQEDLQRRSFLEEFTDNLQRHRILDQEKWKVKLKTLLAKKKENVKKTIPKLSTAIVASILVIVLLPLASSLAQLFDKVYMKIIVTGLPLLAAIGIWIYSYYKNKKKIPLLDLFYIYQHKDLEEVTEETISEDEPSNRRFREWMMELSEDVQKNIIIVFDNMDRLPPSKVQVIWALIHTFFSSQNYKKISVIVPFDRSHIRDAFGNETFDKDFEKTNHFISKTFPVIFNLSPAVLTDWKDFFHQKYQEAFGETENEEYLLTRKIFDLYNSSITPRKIIAFINDLVSFKLIWKKEIKLRYVALFVLNKQQIALDPLPEILNKSFLNRSQNLFTGDDDVSDNIAALLYNVPLEQATQITLSREIEIAIREKRIDSLKEYSKNKNFVSILEQISTEDIEIDATAICLNAIDSSIDKGHSDAIQIIWDRIFGKLLITNLNSLEFTDVHKILIGKVRKSQSKILIKYLVKQFYYVRDFSGSKYYHALNNLENFLKEIGSEMKILPLIEPKNVEAKIFADYVEVAKEDFERYKVTSDNKPLEQYYLEKLNEDIESCIGLKYLEGEYEFPAIKESLESTIKKNDVTIDDLGLIFEIYKTVSSTYYLSAKLGDQKIAELLEDLDENSDEYYELTAMRLGRGKNFSPGGIALEPLSNNPGEKLIEEISLRIRSYNTYGSMLLEVLGWNQPLLKVVLKNLTIGESSVSVSLEKIFPRFKDIIDSISVTSEQMLERLNKSFKSLNDKIDTNNLVKIIPDHSFYTLIGATNNELTRAIWSTVENFIGQSSEETWEEAFKDNESYLFNLLIDALKENKLSQIPDNAFAAYKDTLKAIVTSPENYDISSDSTNLWSTLYKNSDKIHLQPTIKGVRDSFIRETDISDEQFMFFEPLLREYGDLVAISGDVVRRILVPVFSDEDCFDAFVANKDFYSKVIISAGNDAFDFIDNLRSKIEENPENSDVVAFGNLINGELVKKIKIVFGKYYSDRAEDESEIEVTETLKRIVQKEKQIHFKIDNGIVNGDDPDPGHVKNLFVKYSYNGDAREKTFEEHKWLRLP